MQSIRKCLQLPVKLALIVLLSPEKDSMLQIIIKPFKLFHEDLPFLPLDLIVVQMSRFVHFRHFRDFNWINHFSVIGGKQVEDLLTPLLEKVPKDNMLSQSQILPK